MANSKTDISHPIYVYVLDRSRSPSWCIFLDWIELSLQCSSRRLFLLAVLASEGWKEGERMSNCIKELIFWATDYWVEVKSTQINLYKQQLLLEGEKAEKNVLVRSVTLPILDCSSNSTELYVDELGSCKIDVWTLVGVPPAWESLQEMWFFGIWIEKKVKTCNMHISFGKKGSTMLCVNTQASVIHIFLEAQRQLCCFNFLSMSLLMTGLKASTFIPLNN